MASPFNPFAAPARGQRGGAQGSTGRGRGTTAGFGSTNAPRGSGAPRAGRARGRGRGSATWIAPGRGRGRGRGTANGAVNGTTHQSAEGTQPNGVHSPFAQPSQQSQVASPFGTQPAQDSPFSRTPNGTPPLSSTNPSLQPPSVNPFQHPTTNNPFAQQSSNMASPAPSGFAGGAQQDPPVPIEHASAMNMYQERYDQLKIDRAAQRQQAIKAGQMADPNQPTSLNQAITPVGTCTSMCPEFESVERIVQKMVDKCEKYLHPSTGELQNMETKMLKRFRRSAAGYDEQLPSDIRTPNTLLQTMNYLMRYVIEGNEPLAIIHKFVWDRTRSIRNDFSVQQLTQEADVKVAVTCLERIARFHIVSLHLLSSPANTEPFDHHQEREQLNNTMLSLMYYYDDNRGRITFANEPEFRAYYILFSIHDQRPDLEARVQKWPADLLASDRVQVALELFAAAGNTWESQGALDARRPNAIAQGFYTRFFNIINSSSVSYLMACVAEVYFNHIRQTAIRSIWKAYCRTPQSQQAKNDQWTLEELTKVLHFDDDQQTIDFCAAQDLRFAENGQGSLYLDWGDRHVDSILFAPSSDHSFSETYVESKRAGRSLVAIILGMSIRQAAAMSMIDDSLVPARNAKSVKDNSSDEDLFVSDVGNQTPAPVVEPVVFDPLPQAEPATNQNVFAKPDQPAPTSFSSPFQGFGGSSQPDGMFSAPPADDKPSNPFFKPPTDSAAVQPPSAPSPQPNPFAKPLEAKKAETAPVTAGVASSPFNTLFQPQPATGATQPSIFSSAPSTSSPFAQTQSPFPQKETPKPAAAGTSTLFSSSSPNFASSTSTNPPTVAPTSSPATSSGANFFTSSSPFSFASPSQKAETPAAPKPASSSPFQLSSQSSAPTASTLFQPISTTPAPSTAKNPFEGRGSFGSGAPATSTALSKAPETSQAAEPTAAITPAPSTSPKPENASQDSSVTSKNLFGFSQEPSPAVAPATSTLFDAPSKSSSPFSFTTLPKPTEQPNESNAGEKKAEPFSFKPAENPFSSMFAPPKAQQPSLEPESSPTTAPTPEKQPSIFSHPAAAEAKEKKEPFSFTSASSPFQVKDSPSAAAEVQGKKEPFSFTPASSAFQVKDSPSAAAEVQEKKEPFSFSSASSPFQVNDSPFAPPKSQEPSQKADNPISVASKPEEQPVVPTLPPIVHKSTEAWGFRSSAPGKVQAPLSSEELGSESALQPASQSVSSNRHPAHSPPRTLFEALRQPKIFDAKSSTYAPFDTTATHAPLFRDTSLELESSSQSSLKRHHGASDSDVPREHKRRSSLKGKSTTATSEGSLRRSVHFEEPSVAGSASSKKSSTSLGHKSSQNPQKKRQIDERTDIAQEQGPSSKVSKVSPPEEHTPFSFSVYKAENRPIPKLPILEKLEKKLAEAKALCEPKPLTEEELQQIEEARLRRARQVDEDEIALSRARILAEQLKNGPGIFDGFVGPYRQPWDDPDWDPLGPIVEKYRSQIPNDPPYVSPKLILTRTPSGRHQVAYAPDTPGRPMSRTERRIRHTGARGLASVPLDFQRRRAASRAQAPAQHKEVTGRKDIDAKGDPSRSI
ncbi:uncharacterized protein N7506_011884 [Penicillium brevicompactum]|uniref:uncharacterized protein n=1 Tax=Penicillium brevicompactum TaxID=5074 RepID=UPI0025405C45|nr:uncharacterized protein N7506_011884 [Penicillium brevicompactum]KAJ5319180.1 hypothetical protein N7506_011884 [Penicillium brevicompactum]